MPNGSSRRARHARVASALSELEDADLQKLVATGKRLGSGIGGDTVLISVENIDVFVKRIPLTDRERAPAHLRSTANVFGLPDFCHYGIGSPGFGAWREVAGHELTTRWVLDGEAASFPLAYHSRVVPARPWALPSELCDVEESVRYWNGAPGVRARIEGLAAASAAVLMFLEYVPYTLDAWLAERMSAGAPALDAACSMVERELHTAADLMAERGFLHLDAHFENILTDGSRLYLADFGLAMSKEFALSDEEAAFFDRHRGYDRSYMFAQLNGWLTARLGDHLPPEASRIVRRYEPIVAAVRPFYGRLQTESRTAEYPVAAERAAWETINRSR